MTKALPLYTEFKRCISKTGWKGLDKRGKWVDIPADAVIDYLLFRNFHNEIIIEKSANAHMCVHCEGWMRGPYASESIQYKKNCWLHVHCVDDWLTTACNPELYEETEWSDLADSFARWFGRSGRGEDAMTAHRALSQHFGDAYTNALRLISARH